jgi:hypothetical protein
MTMEADRVGQEGRNFNADVHVALQYLKEQCACPDPALAFDPSAARADLDWLQPLGDPNSEASKRYNAAISAFARGSATPEQQALIIQTEEIKGAFGALQDKPRT